MPTTKSTISRLLFLHTQTPMHPGSGTALGVIDLPVQRERHTLWPTIPGSSLKGVFRDACRRATGAADAQLLAAFGPETNEADAHAGALAITDARVLAFPVRSLRGVFAWVTCPAALERLRRDAATAGWDAASFPEIPHPGAEEAMCNSDSQLLVENSSLVLEEFEFQRVGDCAKLSDWMAKFAVDQWTADRLRSHLIVVHDDHFTHFVRHATEVVARIGLDYEKKTVKTGALFYQEFLPAETIFYGVVFAGASRREGTDASARQIMQWVADQLPSVLQIGGDETTGKGICCVRFEEHESIEEPVS